MSENASSPYAVPRSCQIDVTKNNNHEEGGQTLLMENRLKGVLQQLLQTHFLYTTADTSDWERKYRFKKGGFYSFVYRISYNAEERAEIREYYGVAFVDLTHVLWVCK